MKPFPVSLKRGEGPATALTLQILLPPIIYNKSFLYFIFKNRFLYL